MQKWVRTRALVQESSTAATEPSTTQQVMQALPVNFPTLPYTPLLPWILLTSDSFLLLACFFYNAEYAVALLAFRSFFLHL